MKKTLIFFLMLLTLGVSGHDHQGIFEKANSFYPQDSGLNELGIEWGKLTVPENWDDEASAKIELAVARLKNNSGLSGPEAVIMINGGPGAATIESVWWWTDHPLRETHDIVLLDVRGTGFSNPRLCPELGKELLNILSLDQDASENEDMKVRAVLECQQELLGRGVDIAAYNSLMVSRDIHALKKSLGYQSWSVYGVSYGTHIAQVYAGMFPGDMAALILDSPISTIGDYYETNTSNYVNSLTKVFQKCKDDGQCNARYPDLTLMYLKTIDMLVQDPIEVSVDQTIIPAGTFTFNAEDFKMAVHQTLYDKDLIGLLPLLIEQFSERNEKVLGALVEALSGAFDLDYGMYFCVTCDEVIPPNVLERYDQDVLAQGLIKDGLSFYRSDFLVCEQWARRYPSNGYKLDSLPPINVSTLILTGGLDPITPARNGTVLFRKMDNAHLIEAPAYGHAVGFSEIGYMTVTDFLKQGGGEVENRFRQEQIDFVTDIHINGGISRLGSSLNDFNILFLTPLIIAIVVSFLAVCGLVPSMLQTIEQNKLTLIIKMLLCASSVLAIIIAAGLIIGVGHTASQNFYILAFGLPGDYSFLFRLIFPNTVLILSLLILFLTGVKFLKNRSVLFSILFSNMLISWYFYYWGIIGFI